MTSQIDHYSLQAICGDSNHIMIYGWEHCQFDKVSDLLEKDIKSKINPVCKIKVVYDYRIGKLGPFINRTHEGRLIERLNYVNTIANLCKIAIVNLLLENCKRHLEQLPLIPLFLIIDKEENPYLRKIESISTSRP